MKTRENYYNNLVCTFPNHPPTHRFLYIYVGKQYKNDHRSNRAPAFLHTHTQKQIYCIFMLNNFRTGRVGVGGHPHLVLKINWGEMEMQKKEWKKLTELDKRVKA